MNDNPYKKPKYWPAIVRYTLTALVAVAIGAFGFGGWVAARSADAEAGASLAPRVAELEAKHRVMEEKIQSMPAKLDELTRAVYVLQGMVAGKQPVR